MLSALTGHSRIDRVQQVQVLINLRSLTQSDMHALTEMETTDVEDEEPPTPPKPKPFTPNPAGWPANGDEVA